MYVKRVWYKLTEGSCEEFFVGDGSKIWEPFAVEQFTSTTGYLWLKRKA